MKKKIRKFTYRTCKKCGWVAFAVSQKYAEAQVKSFNKYYDGLDPVQQQSYYGGKKASIRSYERCGFCGTCQHNFRRFKKDDCPNGVTLSPIIYER